MVDFINECEFICTWNKTNRIYYSILFRSIPTIGLALGIEQKNTKSM
jgi:hypothetical protein